MTTSEIGVFKNFIFVRTNHFKFITTMTYNAALIEFKEESDDGKTRLVYAYFGLACYLAQCMEEGLESMLWLKRLNEGEATSNDEVVELIESYENSKKTMGNLVYELKGAYQLAQDDADSLSTFLRNRNYLAHKFFKVQSEKFFSNKGKLEMIKYCCEFTDSYRVLDTSLKKYYASYLNRLGMTEQKIEEFMKVGKNEEKQRDSEKE